MNNRMIITVALIAVATGSLGIGLWTVWGPSRQSVADPENQHQIACGEAVYKKHCASCHGAKLEGQPKWRVRKTDGRLPAPPHDEDGHTWHHPDEHLFQLTKHGLRPPLAPEGYKSDMPGFASALQDEDIWAVLAVIKKSWPPHIAERQRRINEAYLK